MQKIPHTLTVIAGILFLLFTSACTQPGSTSPEVKYSDQMVSVYRSDSGTMSSYQADVKTWYQNNRSPNLPELRTEYRLSMKVVDGKLRTRIDFSSDSQSDRVARSILSDGVTMLVLNTTSNTVEQRLSVTEDQNRLALMTDSLQCMGRINLDSMQSVARRLSLDISDNTPGILQIAIPPSTLPPMPNNAKIASYKLSFDSTESVLLDSEMVIAEEDGTKVTVTTTPIYQEEGEDLIKVGEQTITAYDLPGTLDISDNVVQSYASAEEIPEISAEELAALQAEGTVSTSTSDVILGDLSDPDYTETQLTVYDDVKINTLADSLFRMDL